MTALLAPMSAEAAALLNQIDLRAPIDHPGLTTPMQLIIFMSMLTILPFILIMTTSFVRTVIVFSFLRQAMGTQTIPPNPVMIGLALFLSIYTMNPVWTAIDHNAIQPYLHRQIDQATAISDAVNPLRDFMIRQTDEHELAFFVRLTHEPDPKTPSDVPMQVAIPAFMISELTTSFKIGFVIYIPFLVIDLVVANVLMALGMSMLPPQMISTSVKILIFTLANGWHLIAQAVVSSFR